MRQSTPSTVTFRSRMTAVRANQNQQGASPLAAMMMLYFAVVVGQIGNIIPGAAHLHLAKIVAALAILVVLLNRATLAPISIWSLAPVRLTFLIMGLVSVSILFSVLRHATLDTITGTALSVCVGLVLMIKSARNWASVRRLLLGCVLSALVLCFAAEITRDAGRAGFTNAMDPNDFAFVLDGLMPICVAFVAISRGFNKFCFAGGSLLIVLEILRTESRGGLLGLLCAVALMIVLLPSSGRGHLLPKASKAKMATRIIIVVMSGILLWHLIPESARARLATLRHPVSGYNANVDDRSGRFSIWLQTLPLALHRPWGWGAGAFNTVDGKYGGGQYRAAHNMYLQALIELGIEGLALFVALLGSSFRRLTREAFARPDPTERDALEKRAFARVLIASLGGLCVSGFFLAELYMQALWIVIILTCLVGRDESSGSAISQKDARTPS